MLLDCATSPITGTANIPGQHSPNVSKVCVSLPFKELEVVLNRIQEPFEVYNNVGDNYQETLMLIKPLHIGWKKEFFRRQTGKASGLGKIVGDVYYFAPCGKKLRSMVDIRKYLAEYSSTHTLS